MANPLPLWWRRAQRALNYVRQVLARRWRLWRAAANPEPAGAIVRDQFWVDDGVNYSLPLVTPLGLDAQQRAAWVTETLREANAAFHFQFDRPYQSRDSLVMPPTAEPLREWDHQTRKEVLARTHLAYERNPLAGAAVRLTTYFAVGQGLTVSYTNQRVAEIVEAFRADPANSVHTYEKQFCNDLQVDGELFIQFFAGQDGAQAINPIPPWEIDYIQTERGFRKRPVEYHRLGEQSDGTPGNYEHIDQAVPAGEVLHVAINAHSYETRGRPELFRILPWLRAYKDWLENRARQNHWRGGLIWDVTLKNSDPGKVAAKRAQYRQPPSPGSMVIHNENEVWAPLENKASAGDAADDGRQIKLMTAIGAQLPEYMLSDGANANLASATAQQLPALKKFEDFQDVMAEQVWTPIYRRVIESAIEAGVLAEVVELQDADGEPILDAAGQPRTVRAVDAFTVACPELTATDPKNLAEALQIAVTNEWASNETAAQQMGFDAYAERKKIEAEAQARTTAAYQGRGARPAAPAPAEPPAPEPEAEPAATEALRQLLTAAPDGAPAEEDGMLSIRLPRPQVNVTVPAAEPAPAPQVTVVLPEPAAPPATPVVDMTPVADALTALGQQLASLPAPQVTVTPTPVTVTVPPAPAPVVQVPSDATFTVERDAAGNIRSVTKRAD